MTNTELAKKALEKIDDKTFECGLSSYEGGACGDGWCGDGELELTKEQIMHLLKERIENKELFEGIKTEEIDLEQVLTDMALEASWPDGGISAEVNDPVPSELTELSEKLDGIEDEEDKEEALREIREELDNVGDDEYTFYFTIENYEDSHTFEEEAEETIELTSEEAIGLLWGQHSDLEDLFKEYCDKPLDEDFVNEKAKEKGFASEYDNYSYRGDSEYLENYLEGWKYVVDGIMSGEITEKNLKSWLKYFDDDENLEYEISIWHEDEDEDEE